MGWPGYWLTLLGLASETINQNDIIVDQATREVCIYYPVMRKRKSQKTTPGFSGEERHAGGRGWKALN